VLNGTPAAARFRSHFEHPIWRRPEYLGLRQRPCGRPLVLVRAGNADMDFEPDSDVDLSEFAIFQGCFSDPNRPPACAP